MWYALQISITLLIAYVYLSDVSEKKDVGHALFLGALVALYATWVLTLFFDLIRSAIVKLRRKSH
jgi:uncharacterized membrane protein